MGTSGNVLWVSPLITGYVPLTLDLTCTGLMGTTLQCIGARKSVKNCSNRYELCPPIPLPDVYNLTGHIRGLYYGIFPHPFDYHFTSASDLLDLMTMITGVAVTVIAMNICIPTIWWELCALTDVAKCTVLHVCIRACFCMSTTASLIRCVLTTVVNTVCYTVHSSRNVKNDTKGHVVISLSCLLSYSAVLRWLRTQSC